MLIPLFPLHTTLFPGARLALKIFEARYMDMTTACLKDGSAFGVCLISSGNEVASAGQAAATPHAIGTLANISEWDMRSLGVLHINILGGQRFRVRSATPNVASLLLAEIELLPDEAVVAVPSEYAALVTLLQAIIEQQADNLSKLFQSPHRYDDASWVGMRLAQVMPIPEIAKQKLLEVDDPLIRLEILYRFLSGQGLLPDKSAC